MSSGTEQAATSLIEAKLAQPRARPGVVLRSRLFRELDRLEHVELTLLSGPAGSGKTVLASSWLAGRQDLATAWVTLDRRDDDPVRLWTYIAHAVDRIRPGIARPALRCLQTPRSPIEAAIDELMNALGGYAGRLAIVLDDLHHACSDAALRSVVYAVEHVPPTTRIVATTRSDHGLRLRRLRARGALGELRASDMAFTVDEARELLVETAAIPVGNAEISELVQRTEGWPAGLSLAALWLARADAPAEDIVQFSGDHRHIADYLTSEVLDSLDGDSRSFLLHTSVFGRFTAPLCDEVLGTPGVAVRLAELERSNLFLIPLDARGAWYRYHHTFREVMRGELAHNEPDTAAVLHRRAARWFADRGLFEEALDHAAASGDAAALGDLLLEVHLPLIRTGALDLLLASLAQLPDSELVRRPSLAAAGGLAAGLLGQPSSRRRQFAATAEAGIGDLPDGERAYVQGMIAVTRSALLDGDIGVALGHAERAVDLGRGPVGDLTVAALAVEAYLRLLNGEMDAARLAADEAVARPEAAKRPHGLIYAHGVRALLECDAGRPRAAETEARHAVALARELGLSSIISAGIAHDALGRALLMLGRAREAERELERAEVLRRAQEPRLDHAHTLLALAEARIARGRLALASTELEAAREQIGSVSDAGRLPDLAADVQRLLQERLEHAEHAVEPPSPAELAVLRLLAGDLSQREIGNELFLSMNTVKTHTRNLYLKLGVNSRDAAVRAASALGLLESAESPG